MTTEDIVKKNTIWRIAFHGSASSFYLTLLLVFMNHHEYMVFVERMITTWYLALHIGFVFLRLLQDFVNLIGRQSKIARILSKISNLLFIALIFPFALYIPLVYWFLFYYNSNLIHPSFLVISLPSWISTSSHSVISLVALLEIVSTKYDYDGNYISSLTILVTFALAYASCLIGTYVQYGFWLYPLFHLFSSNILPFVFFIMLTLLICMFFLGTMLTQLFHDGGPGVKSPPSSALHEVEELVGNSQSNLGKNVAATGKEAQVPTTSSKLIEKSAFSFPAITRKSAASEFETGYSSDITPSTFNESPFKFLSLRQSPYRNCESAGPRAVENIYEKCVPSRKENVQVMISSDSDSAKTGETVTTDFIMKGESTELCGDEAPDASYSKFYAQRSDEKSCAKARDDEYRMRHKNGITRDCLKNNKITFNDERMRANKTNVQDEENAERDRRITAEKEEEEEDKSDYSSNSADSQVKVHHNNPVKADKLDSGSRVSGEENVTLKRSTTVAKLWKNKFTKNSFKRNKAEIKELKKQMNTDKTLSKRVHDKKNNILDNLRIRWEVMPDPRQDRPNSKHKEKKIEFILSEEEIPKKSHRTATEVVSSEDSEMAVELNLFERLLKRDKIRLKVDSDALRTKTERTYSTNSATKVDADNSAVTEEKSESSESEWEREQNKKAEKDARERQNEVNEETRSNKIKSDMDNESESSGSDEVGKRKKFSEDEKTKSKECRTKWRKHESRIKSINKMERVKLEREKNEESDLASGERKNKASKDGKKKKPEEWKIKWREERMRGRSNKTKKKKKKKKKRTTTTTTTKRRCKLERKEDKVEDERSGERRKKSEGDCKEDATKSKEQNSHETIIFQKLLKGNKSTTERASAFDRCQGEGTRMGDALGETTRVVTWTEAPMEYAKQYADILDDSVDNSRAGTSGMKWKKYAHNSDDLAGTDVEGQDGDYKKPAKRSFLQRVIRSGTKSYSNTNTMDKNLRKRNWHESSNTSANEATSSTSSNEAKKERLSSAEKWPPSLASDERKRKKPINKYAVENDLVPEEREKFVNQGLIGEEEISQCVPVADNNRTTVSETDEFVKNVAVAASELKILRKLKKLLEIDKKIWKMEKRKSYNAKSRFESLIEVLLEEDLETDVDKEQATKNTSARVGLCEKLYADSELELKINKSATKPTPKRNESKLKCIPPAVATTLIEEEEEEARALDKKKNHDRNDDDDTSQSESPKKLLKLRERKNSNKLIKRPYFFYNPKKSEKTVSQNCTKFISFGGKERGKRWKNFRMSATQKLDEQPPPESPDLTDPPNLTHSSSTEYDGNDDSSISRSVSVKSKTEDDSTTSELKSLDYKTKSIKNQIDSSPNGDLKICDHCKRKVLAMAECENGNSENEASSKKKTSIAIARLTASSFSSKKNVYDRSDEKIINPTSIIVRDTRIRTHGSRATNWEPSSLDKLDDKNDSREIGVFKYAKLQVYKPTLDNRQIMNIPERKSISEIASTCLYPEPRKLISPQLAAANLSTTPSSSVRLPFIGDLSLPKENFDTYKFSIDDPNNYDQLSRRKLTKLIETFYDEPIEKTTYAANEQLKIRKNYYVEQNAHEPTTTMTTTTRINLPLKDALHDEEKARKCEQELAKDGSKKPNKEEKSRKRSKCEESWSTKRYIKQLKTLYEDYKNKKIPRKVAVRRKTSERDFFSSSLPSSSFDNKQLDQPLLKSRERLRFGQMKKSKHERKVLPLPRDKVRELFIRQSKNKKKIKSQKDDAHDFNIEIKRPKKKRDRKPIVISENGDTDEDRSCCFRKGNSSFNRIAIPSATESKRNERTRTDEGNEGNKKMRKKQHPHRHRRNAIDSETCKEMFRSRSKSEGKNSRLIRKLAGESDREIDQRPNSKRNPSNGDQDITKQIRQLNEAQYMYSDTDWILKMLNKIQNLKKLENMNELTNDGDENAARSRINITLSFDEEETRNNAHNASSEKRKTRKSKACRVRVRLTEESEVDETKFNRLHKDKALADTTVPDAVVRHKSYSVRKKKRAGRSLENRGSQTKQPCKTVLRENRIPEFYPASNKLVEHDRDRTRTVRKSKSSRLPINADAKIKNIHAFEENNQMKENIPEKRKWIIANEKRLKLQDFGLNDNATATRKKHEPPKSTVHSSAGATTNNQQRQQQFLKPTNNECPLKSRILDNLRNKNKMKHSGREVHWIDEIRVPVLNTQMKHRQHHRSIEGSVEALSPQKKEKKTRKDDWTKNLNLHPFARILKIFTKETSLKKEANTGRKRPSTCKAHDLSLAKPSRPILKNTNGTFAQFLCNDDLISLEQSVPTRVL